jgi:hypothetical protein
MSVFPSICHSCSCYPLCLSFHLCVCHSCGCSSIHLSVTNVPVCLSIFLSAMWLYICQSVYLFIHLFVYMLFHLSVCLSCTPCWPCICLSIHSNIPLSVCRLSLYLSLPSSVRLFVYPSICLPICFHVPLSVCSFVCQSIFLKIIVCQNQIK